MRLAGTTIAITRPRHQAEELRRLIEQEGGRALLFPTIEILPPEEWTECDDAIDHLQDFDGLLFTSSNGVARFLERAASRGAGPASLHGKKIFAVGEATAGALAASGIGASVAPGQSTAAAMAKAIGAEEIGGCSFLFPTGDLTSPALAGSLRLLGAGVKTLIVYRTCRAAPPDVDAFFIAVRNGQVDWITFTSPSSVHNFLQLFAGERIRVIRATTRIGVIGPTTAQAAAEAGLPPLATASRAGSKELVDAMCAVVTDARSKR